MGMVDTEAVAVVFSTALIAWLIAIVVTAGWDDLVIIVWSAILVFGAAAIFYVTEASDSIA